MGMRGSYNTFDGDFVQKDLANPKGLLEKIDFNGPSIEIDQAWQAIHFLLCGVSFDGEPPLGYVVPLRGENALDLKGIACDVDMFALTSQQVQEAYHSIKDMGEQELRAKYHPESFAEKKIYGWIDDEKEFEYIYERFRFIQDFYQEASQNNRGMIFQVK